MRRSLIPTAVVISIVLLSLNGAPAYGGGRGRPGGVGRGSGGFSGGRHFASMPARGGQTFTRSGMGTWGGQRWGGRNWNGGNWNRNWSGQQWSGRNWNGGNWSGNWHRRRHFHDDDDFNHALFLRGFPFWGWGWGYAYRYSPYRHTHAYDDPYRYASPTALQFNDHYGPY